MNLKPRRTAWISLEISRRAPVAQLDRVLGYEEVNRWFESGELCRRLKGLEEGTVPHGMRSDQNVTRLGRNGLSARL